MNSNKVTDALNTLPKYAEKDKAEYERILARLRTLPSKDTLTRELAAMGVGLTRLTVSEFEALVKLIQIRFRPAKADGHLDAETVAIIYALHDAWLRKQRRAPKVSGNK